jgi:tetratricopeptide (TPR) repeat protein
MTMLRPIIAAAFALACASTAAAQVPVAPAAPPVPPAAVQAPAPAPAPAAPVPPAPPVRAAFDGHYVDVASFELHAITEGARAIAESAMDFHRFEFAAAPGQIVPVPPQPAPAPGSISINPFFYDGNGSQYDRGRGYIDRSQYDRAVEAFNQVINNRSEKADAAMYWKAYSLNKLARRSDASAALADLQKQFPKSRWLDDARRLDVEIRQSSGQPVSANALDDEELKLLVLQGLMQSDPDAALPQIEKMLSGSGSVRLKERALFVASRSRSPRGRQVVTAAARSSSNPDVQMSAILYLGRISGPESAQALEEVYRTTNDNDVKKRILQSLAAANAEDKLGPIARNEKDPELKRMAIRQLGISRRADVGETLTGIYNADSSVDVRKAVIDALAQNSRNETSVAALVALARAEKNPELRTDIVRRLSTTKSPAARDYMLELLAK